MMPYHRASLPCLPEILQSVGLTAHPSPTSLFLNPTSLSGDPRHPPGLQPLILPFPLSFGQGGFFQLTTFNSIFRLISFRRPWHTVWSLERHSRSVPLHTYSFLPHHVKFGLVIRMLMIQSICSVL